VPSAHHAEAVSRGATLAPDLGLTKHLILRRLWELLGTQLASLRAPHWPPNCGQQSRRVIELMLSSVSPCGCSSPSRIALVGAPWSEHQVAGRRSRPEPVDATRDTPRLSGQIRILSTLFGSRSTIVSSNGLSQEPPCRVQTQRSLGLTRFAWLVVRPMRATAVSPGRNPAPAPRPRTAKGQNRPLGRDTHKTLLSKGVIGNGQVEAAGGGGGFGQGALNKRPGG
jgi:hypothetical protein